MKNILRLIALLLLVSSCNYSSNNTDSNIPTDVVEPSGATVETPAPVEEGPGHEASKPIGPEYPVADVKKVFTVKITDTNYSPAQKKKLAEAEKLIEKIFNSEDYRKAVLSRKFTSTKLSSEEVYDKLFKGAEALQPALNYQMDLKVTMYFKRFTKVVGYTYPSSLTVYTNSKFHDGYDACEVASNLVHEWTHKMQFDHATAKDSSSVPYSHNDIVKELCHKFL